MGIPGQRAGIAPQPRNLLDNQPVFFLKFSRLNVK
jgi:hypothetical protein